MQTTETKSEFSKELRRMAYEDIENVLSDKKMMLMRLRNKSTDDQLKKSPEWVETKKDIARCMTVLTEKKREEIRREAEEKNIPLPKFLRKKQSRAMRVNMPKEMLQRYCQNKHRLRKRVVVFASNKN